jgi:uncharacterized protein
MKWFQNAADQGESMGQYYLGVMYSSGREGVRQDYAEAVKWLRKAAEQEVLRKLYETLKDRFE